MNVTFIGMFYERKIFEVDGIRVVVGENGPHCGLGCQYDGFVWKPRHCQHTLAVVFFARECGLNITERPTHVVIREPRPLTREEEFFDWVCGRETNTL